MGMIRLQNKWIYFQVIIVLWAFYLLTLHLSNGDHFFINILFFLSIFSIAYKLGNYFEVRQRKRWMFIAMTYLMVQGGQMIFNSL